MNTASRTALAVGGGYLLGRTRRLRFALLIGSAVTGRTLPTSPADLLRIGSALAADSAEFRRVRGAVRARLFPAGRAAVVAAAGHQLETLTARLSPPDDVLAADVDRDAGAVTIGEPLAVLAPVDVVFGDHARRVSENGHLPEGAP